MKLISIKNNNMNKILLLVSLIIYPISSIGQTFSLEHDHSTIQVKDIDVSVEFYKTILQFEELDTPWPENPTIKFFNIGNNQQLHIAEVDFYGTIKINRVLHLAFTTKDLESYVKFLTEKGIEYFNFNEEVNKFQKRPDGVRQIYFKDPDGYWIEVNDASHN